MKNIRCKGGPYANSKREKKEKEDKVRFICMERSFGEFKRIVRLPFPIDRNNVNAFYKNGILTIKLPKIQEKRGTSKKISIDDASD